QPEYPWKGAHGIGAKLMIDQGLPRDENRDPYQTCFWFDEDGPIALVRDTDGTPLGWESTSSSDPNEWGLRRLPPAIVAAAEEAERSWRSPDNPGDQGRGAFECWFKG